MPSHSLRTRVARSPWQRAVGLIGRTSIGADDAVLFERCSSIHTLFMRMPIDVVFLDGERRAVKTFSNVPPWRLYVGCREARSVLEMAGGELQRRGIKTGDSLTLD